MGFRNQEEKLEKGEISTPSGGRYGQKKFLTIMKGKKRKGKNIASFYAGQVARLNFNLQFVF